MTKTRWIGLALILMSSAISIQYGSSFARTTDGLLDFRSVYYAARCLLEGHNPYSEKELERVFVTAEPVRAAEPLLTRQVVTLCIYTPTAFVFAAPFAMLPCGPASLLWMTLTALNLILAAFLMWDIGARFAPGLSLVLTCFLLVNCEALFSNGNAAGLAVSLCVVAVWCFVQERFALAGVLCLALSLAIKPHDAGLVWLCFLLAGGLYRKRALQTLVPAVVLGLFALVWISHIAPHWRQQLQSNLLQVWAPGGLSNPGPTNLYGRGPSAVIDLQSTLSFYRDDPRFYNLISFLVCGALLLVWMIRTIRFRITRTSVWYAIAPAVILTLLISYHRPYDAKLLLLAIPACAMLWAKGGLTKWLALLFTTAGFVFTADVPLTIVYILSKNLHISLAGQSGLVLTALVNRPTPIVLLAMGVFYLWIYVRRNPAQDAMEELAPQ
jgi:hypothetical protein